MMSKKRLLSISFFLFLLLVTNLLVLACEKNTPSLSRCYGTPQRVYQEGEIKSIRDSLYAEYGRNKLLIEDFELQILTALSFYPELKDVEIHFKYSKESTTMACRPNIFSLFTGERVYDILVNNNQDFEGILLQDVPFNAQIGVIGHEIAHIVDYEGKNTLGILQVGLNYLNDEDKKELENYIDRLTIQRGLGWQLNDWAQYSMYDSPKATEEYKRFKQEIYLQPKQIIEEMEIYSCYQDSSN